MIDREGAVDTPGVCGSAAVGNPLSVHQEVVRPLALMLAEEMQRHCLSEPTVRDCLRAELGLNDDEIDAVLRETVRRRQAAVIDPRSGLPPRR